MTLRKSWRVCGFGVLVLAAGGCGPEENFAEPPPVAVPQAGSPAEQPPPDRVLVPNQPAQPFVPDNTGPNLPVGGSCAAPAIAVAPPGFAVAINMSGALSGPTVRATTPPPPISGGTLLTTRDGTLLVAADPERDQIYFVDLKTSKLQSVRPLLAGDEPGRLVEDEAGRIHVVLRGGRAIASLTRDAQSPVTRREVCSVPRGIAYDAAHDQLHVACAEGSLVSLGAAPTASVSRRIDVGSDARDVIVRGDRLFVSHFRSAQLDEIDAQGARMQRMQPATFTRDEQRFVEDKSMSNANVCGLAGQFLTEQVDSAPNVAWRAIDVPNMGVAMLHQRARMGEVQITQGGYGSGACGSGIVQTSLTVGLDKPGAVSVDMGSLTLAVDIATDPDGALLAVVAPGNFGFQSQLSVLPISQLGLQPTAASDAATPVPAPSGAGGSFAAGAAPFPQDPNHCLFPNQTLPEPAGQATAVTFASPYQLAVLSRQPAAIEIYDLRTNTLQAHIDLQQASTEDTGHSLFHLRAGAGVACASCHPEAGDDSHVWTFHDIGARRTQSLRGGILGTEPFHWNGDMKNFGTLMSEVFVRRMAGFEPRSDQADALAGWIDKQPALHADAKDPLAAMRGKQLFESPDVGCSDCHGGAHGTSNENKDVGTGAELQVPALKGLAFRTPLMHDGCAPTIMSRFSDPKCGGGDDHGQVSQLSSAQLSDLTAYLETL